MEKFRPTLVKDIVGNTDAVERLKVIGAEGNMPNIILAVRTSPLLPHMQHFQCSGDQCIMPQLQLLACYSKLDWRWGMMGVA